jgi:hypothetical protein
MNINYKDKKFFILEIIFFASIIANLLLSNNLYLKILLIALYILFFIMYVPEYIYNKSKFIFINISLIICMILFLILKYITSLNYIVFVVCYLVLFLYLSKVLFKTTYGEVISSKKGVLSIKLLDIFYNHNKIIELKSKKVCKKGDLILLNLKVSPFSKNKLSIKNIIKNESK